MYIYNTLVQQVQPQSVALRGPTAVQCAANRGRVLEAVADEGLLIRVCTRFRDFASLPEWNAAAMNRAKPTDYCDVTRISATLRPEEGTPVVLLFASIQCRLYLAENTCLECPGSAVVAQQTSTSESVMISVGPGFNPLSGFIFCFFSSAYTDCQFLRIRNVTVPTIRRRYGI